MYTSNDLAEYMNTAHNEMIKLIDRLRKSGIVAAEETQYINARGRAYDNRTLTPVNAAMVALYLTTTQANTFRLSFTTSYASGINVKDATFKAFKDSTLLSAPKVGNITYIIRQHSTGLVKIIGSLLHPLAILQSLQVETSEFLELDMVINIDVVSELRARYSDSTVKGGWFDLPAAYGYDLIREYRKYIPITHQVLDSLVFEVNHIVKDEKDEIVLDDFLNGSRDLVLLEKVKILFLRAVEGNYTMENIKKELNELVHE